MLSEKRRLRGLYWDRAWYLVDGCVPVDASCENCWAASLHARYKSPAFLNPDKLWNGWTRFNSEKLSLPKETGKPTVFSIWNDLFHENVGYRWIIQTLTKIAMDKRHTFLCCTKRPERIIRGIKDFESITCFDRYDLDNLWFGTTVCDDGILSMNRMHSVLLLGNEFRTFLSFEPVLGDIRLDDLLPENIDLGIVGCESGFKRRVPRMVWLDRLISKSLDIGLPLFIKQWDIDGKFVKLPYPEKYGSLPF